MINLKLYGQPTSTYEYAKMAVLEAAEKAGIKINLTEINDINVFIKEGIKSVPTFKINNHLEINYSKKMDMTAFLKKTIQSILKEENYGVMKKVLVPIDFSSTSQNALLFAVNMAREHNMVIKILHAYHPIVAEVNGIPVLDPTIEDDRRKQLSRFIKEFEKFDLLQKPIIDEYFRLGYASEEIIEISKTEEIDFIIMGTTGSGSALKKWFGSISLEVLKKAKRPVLIVPPDATYTAFKQVLYATDNPILDIKVLGALRRFLTNHDYSLHLVHVNTKKSTGTVKDLKAIAEDLLPGKKIYGREINAENIKNGLSEYIQNESIDLLVMAKEKRNLWNRLVHSSVTREMAINTHTPLLIYHQKGES